MKCPKCSAECQLEWKVCPKCGESLTADKKESSAFAKTVTVLIMFIAIFGFIHGCSSSKSYDHAAVKTSTSVSKERQVLLTAAFTKGYIIIRNENNFDWTNAKIKVANSTTDQYDLRVGTIKSGEIKTFDLSEFINLDGKRYNGYQYVPKWVLVYADNANGGKQY